MVLLMNEAVYEGEGEGRCSYAFFKSDLPAKTIACLNTPVKEGVREIVKIRMYLLRACFINGFDLKSGTHA